MSLSDILLLIGAGIAAGAINSMAGGGSFFSFAALVAAGLPTLDANATSAAALAPSNVVIVGGHGAELREHARAMVGFALIGIVGGAIGAAILVAIGDDGFRPLVPWLLLVATLLFAFSAQLRRLMPSTGQSGPAAKALGFATMLAVSIYGGFFGAGMGIVMLAALAVLEDGDYLRANAVKNVVAMLIQAISAAILIATGLVHWPQGLIVMAASSIGGFLGVRLVRKIPQNAIRAGVVVAGAALTLVFFLR